MYFFLIPLLLGFAIAGASAFTAAYSRWWGEKGGALATSILRNLVGIPLWMVGFMLAWVQPATMIFNPGWAIKVPGWILLAVGMIPVIWGHLALGWRTHFPSIRDTLVRDGLYGQLRHPIYAGGLLEFVGLALLKPTSTVVLACALGFIWLIIEARLEEIDLVLRLPAYRQYMKEVPRFIPRLQRRGARTRRTRADERGE
jgi:protein-S-isoprenylcysteine O-methyltransferase Ste14